MDNATRYGSKRAIAIITMMFLFGMISFVTNLAAPIGVIWKNAFCDSPNANTIGMLGNAMNFLAYLFMGIPSGRMIVRFGYKDTALFGIILGFTGIFLQYLSGTFTDAIAGFSMYLVGAFVCGFSVCMLNTVVNPMINLLGGGGNKGNQLNLIGGTLNSLTGTLTPMFVGSLIGTVTPLTKIEDVNVVLFIAMAVFLVSYIILKFLRIDDPYIESNENSSKTMSLWDFKNFKYGAIAIFLYVGAEVGIPGTLFFYISDNSYSGGGYGLERAAAIAGFVAATYWFLMLVGRFTAGFIAGKVASNVMLTTTATVAVCLIIGAITLGNSISVNIPVFTGSSFEMFNLPIAALLLMLCGLCTSVMWSCIFNLSTEGLGEYTAIGTGIFITMVVGGGIMPLVQNYIADHVSYMCSFIIPLISMTYILFYAVKGCKR